jgi:hypothetical protein
VETLLRKQNLLPEMQKSFLPTSETFDVSHQCLPVFAHSGKHGETLVGNNVFLVIALTFIIFLLHLTIEYFYFIAFFIHL